MGRLGGISDGVFAIAMTLLVLDIKLPELDDPLSSQAFAEALAAQMPHFIAWLISFAILCQLWIPQHALLEGDETKGRGFTVLTFVFLGTVSFIPFPTSLISEHLEQPLAVIIFSALIAISGFVLAGLWFVDRKMGESVDSESMRAVKRVIISSPSIAAIACLLSLIDTRLSIVVWILLPIIGNSIRRRKMHAAS